MKTIILAIIFVLNLVPVLAQKMETNSSDVRIVKDRPSVYISFERQGILKPLHTGESNRRVWLRFHNNSKWQVGFCVWNVPKEYGDKDVTYEAERYENKSKPAPITTDPEGSCPRVFIESNKSVLFSVPREHLSEGLAIKVQYHYEWEIEPDGFMSESEAKHFAYFYSSDIPKK
jgi:hypothetical protein